MLWKRNCHNIGFGTFFLVFAFALFFSFFLGTHNTFATTVDCGDIMSSFVEGDRFLSYSLSSCDTSSLDSSKPWIYDVHVSSSSSSSVYAWLGFNASRFGPTLHNQPGSTVFNTLASSIDVNSTVVSPPQYNGQYFYYPYFVIAPIFYFDTLTLSVSDSFPTSDCPVCEECQVCPAIPENPYDDKFDKIIVAIYTCGAILLIIYFFYCIYGMIIKSTGGK